MKFIYIITVSFILSSLLSNAQDFRCLNPNRVALFEREDGNIVAMRIDSVEESGFDTIFYPLKNIRRVDKSYDCFTPYGPSWLGEKILTKLDGTHIFFNKANDTIVIQTQSNINDEWVFYSDSIITVKAKVIHIKYATFLEQVDTVKTISFQVYDKNSNQKESPINDYSIELSKRYGLLKALNFYFFPYSPEDYMYEKLGQFELVGLTNPAIGLQNITWTDIHNYELGDELHVLEYWNDMDCSYTKKQIILRLIEKTNNKDTIRYRFDKIVRLTSLNDCETTVTISNGKFDLTVTENPVFDMLPGEVILSDWEVFNMWMTTTSKTRPGDYGGVMWTYSDSCVMYPISDGCFPDDQYLLGLGGPYYFGYNFFGGECKRELVYYRKSYGEWGVPFNINSLEESVSQTLFYLYPNPASDELTITTETSYKTLEYRILDLTARECKSGMISNDMQKTISITALKSGVYVFILEDEHTILGVRQLVKL